MKLSHEVIFQGKKVTVNVEIKDNGMVLVEHIGNPSDKIDGTIFSTVELYEENGEAFVKAYTANGDGYVTETYENPIEIKDKLEVMLPKRIDGEYIVKVKRNGKLDKELFYYTDGREDAFNTFEAMKKEMES